MLQLEDRLISFLKTAENSLYTNSHKVLNPKGSQPGVMYVLAKIHEPLVEKFFKF